MILSILNGMHFINYNTDYCISRAVNQKDDLEDEGLTLFKKNRSMGIQAEMLQSDNAGENKAYRRPLQMKNSTLISVYRGRNTTAEWQG